VGRIYQQIFVDTYSKWVAAKLYTTKTPITAADLLNDRILPFFTEQGYGRHSHPDRSRYRILWQTGASRLPALSALNDIEHSKTKANHPQTNGICERFHKTILQEFYQVAFRRKMRSYNTIWMTG